MLKNKILSSVVGSEELLYSNDVFSAFTYTGNGSTQTINNGIDLAGKGGLVWIKARVSAYDNYLFDTNRGRSYALVSNSAAGNRTASAAGNDFTAFNSNGFSLGSSLQTTVNEPVTQVAWTFRKAPKFFDIVTYTGNGVAGRQIPHELGVAPGMIIVKRTDLTSDWFVWHRRNGVAGQAVSGLEINSTSSAAEVFGTQFNSGTFNTSSVLNSSFQTGNVNGAQYVAYLFAHDPSADGIIQCGSFTTISGGATVNLGWEPQYILFKTSTSADNWYISDTSRGWVGGYPLSGTQPNLKPNLSNAEVSDGLSAIAIEANGFRAQNLATSATYIYLAIRRPNKPPTTGTEVYNAIARTGTGGAATVTAGFPVDLVITKKRSSTTITGARFTDRLRGKTNWLDSTATTAETITADTVTGFDSMIGIVLGADATTSAFNTNIHTYVNHFFKRSPGFMDVVCYTGTGVARTVPHSLGVAPELMIVKARSGATQWEICSSDIANTEKLVLNSTAAKATNATTWNSTSPTASVFTVGTGANVNDNTTTYVSYLFATKAGISKVFSVTGNGSSQTVNCGFSTGARFVLMKRTDAAGDWYVWDTARGLVVGNDPHLSLNSTAAEVTSDDTVDPDTSGFIINQVAATNMNVNGATYIGLAVA